MKATIVRDTGLPAEAPLLTVPVLIPTDSGSSAVRTRLADYLELTKPRIAVMVLLTVAIGFVLGARNGIDLPLLLHTLFGTLLVAGGASAVNQFLERHYDARMRRTENRPLPSGRLHALEVLTLGCGLGLVGTIYLLALLPHAEAGALAAITFVAYVLLYTPLKRITPLNTLVGAVPGALPPLIGWSAARSTMGADALGLFLILFFWQVPHFLAIAWIYREDYARGGFRMLPVVDPEGRITSRTMIVYCLTLIPVSLVPLMAGEVGWGYAVGAVVLGLLFLGSTLAFARRPGVVPARRVLRASLIYLPVVLLLLLGAVLYHRL